MTVTPGPHPGAPFPGPPTTGEMSTRSKLAAGLLTLFLGGLGVGRFYLGHRVLGVAQLAMTLFGWVLIAFALAPINLFSETSGAFNTRLIPLLLGVIMLLGMGLWVLVEAILVFAGKVPDGAGRPLR